MKRHPTARHVVDSPEEVFERLLAWTARKCEEVISEAWLFHERIVEMVDGWTVTMADTDENPKAKIAVKGSTDGPISVRLKGKGRPNELRAQTFGAGLLT